MCVRKVYTTFYSHVINHALKYRGLILNNRIIFLSQECRALFPSSINEVLRISDNYHTAHITVIFLRSPSAKKMQFISSINLHARARAYVCVFVPLVRICTCTCAIHSIRFVRYLRGCTRTCANIRV